MVISATEARKKTNDIVLQNNNNIIKDINTKIQKAIMDGKYEIYMGLLNSEVCKILTSSGYTVKDVTDPRDGYSMFLIKW